LTEFGSRGSSSTFGDHDYAFTLVDTVRLEGLAFHFGDDSFDLLPRRYNSTERLTISLLPKALFVIKIEVNDLLEYHRPV